MLERRVAEAMPDLHREMDALPTLNSAIVPELEAFLKTVEAIVG